MARTCHATAGWATWTIIALSYALVVGMTGPVNARLPKPRPSQRVYRSRLIPKLYNMAHCTDRHHFFHIRNVSTTMDRFGGDVLDVLFNLNGTAKLLSSIKFSLQRCTGGASQCEHVNTWTWSTGICDLMMTKHMAWSYMVERIHPPIKCPFQMGSYTSPNLTLDLDMVDKAMPRSNIEKHVWLSECQTFDENKNLFACFKWTTEARRVRVKEGGYQMG
ncbi:hypothetical protein FOCC_FOCC015997 [Frankliniella occidentalis]|uniref:Uncharacterized protein LOC113217879 n=1 Tax=Frankliniella occidentalis TaxID=133901 RepID=A0A6J1TJP6_FRAOC|nr:uncharacterized protein LOC113217879 [Frankliniella occidentalis]KAE8738521.1 hypothetical protein FOCC_FOCC015997 [Frankliniella occidentalis]